MQYQSQVFIPTDRFYNVPAFEDYHNQKNAHLNNLPNDYLTRTTAEKWASIIEKLSESLIATDIPNNNNIANEAIVASLRTRLAAFKTNRDNTSMSYYNLSLDKRVSIFSH